jgi:hypothetical protein
MERIIVREYLEALTEKDELDYIFPLLLESMGFRIISTPQITRGVMQHGKDVIAIGKDPIDEIKKRFYFELKGGDDRNITISNYKKNDGIRDSIFQAKDAVYSDSSVENFNNLPIKIVLVHNGDLSSSAQITFDGFIKSTFPENEPIKFERWDIQQLTILFSKYLFSEYLLTDNEALMLFKKVLVLFNTPRNNYEDFIALIDRCFLKAGNLDNTRKFSRKFKLLFETLNLIALILYNQSKDKNNLEPAKICVSYSVIRFWNWILVNKLESKSKITSYFDKHLEIFIKILDDYFIKTIPIAKLNYGLWAQNGGRYEKIGYPLRTMEYMSYLLFYINFKEKDSNLNNYYYDLCTIIKSNDSVYRPFFDNHSIPLHLILKYFIEKGKLDDAKTFLLNCITAIHLGYYTNKRLPDGRNSIDNIIRYAVRYEKSVYYEENTSHLLGMLYEYLAILGLENEYISLRKFFDEAKIDLATFIPYTSKGDFEFEEALFSKQLYSEGFQSEIMLDENFEDFRRKTQDKNEFDYKYRTDKAGYSYLRILTHMYFKTPFFPNEWRGLWKLE